MFDKCGTWYITESVLSVIHSTSHFQLASINGQRYSNTSLPPPGQSVKNCIQLAACGPNELLPMNPDLPADLFTACLTTPIKIALRW